MKARVRETGNIVDVEWYGHNSMGTIYADITHTHTYYEYELDFDTVYDYWTRLEHQAAIAAMQAQMAPDCLDSPEGVACTAYAYAHALVEKYKKEERK